MTLKLIREGNYNFFANVTNEMEQQDIFRSNVTKDDVINYIKTLYNKNGLVKNDDIIDFCEACLVTYGDTDKIQLQKALKNYINANDSSKFSCFSRDDVNKSKNYREIIEKYDRKTIINLIKLFLNIKAINYESCDMDELISIFSDSVVYYGYQEENKKTR